LSQPLDGIAMKTRAAVVRAYLDRKTARCEIVAPNNAFLRSRAQNDRGFHRGCTELASEQPKRRNPQAACYDECFRPRRRHAKFVAQGADARNRLADRCVGESRRSISPLLEKHGEVIAGGRVDP
jgi:hypothetical protein